MQRSGFKTSLLLLLLLPLVTKSLAACCCCCCCFPTAATSSRSWYLRSWQNWTPKKNSHPKAKRKKRKKHKKERKQASKKNSTVRRKKKHNTKEFTKMSHKMHKLQDDKTTVPLYFNSKIPFFFFFFFFCLFQNGSGSKQNGTLRFRFFEEKKIRLERVRFGSKQNKLELRLWFWIRLLKTNSVPVPVLEIRPGCSEKTAPELVV